MHHVPKFNHNITCFGCQASLSCAQVSNYILLWPEVLLHDSLACEPFWGSAFFENLMKSYGVSLPHAPLAHGKVVCERSFAHNF